MYAQISPCLPVKHKTFFGCFLLWTTVDCCGYTLSPSYPQLWYFIYTLSFFRLGNLRWPFCLRCFQGIHCNSVRNLRPLHTPSLEILSCSPNNLMFCPPPPSSSSKKKQNKTKTKQNKTKSSLYICMQMATQTDRHLLQAVHFNHGGLNWLCTINPHDSWNITCLLPYLSSPASWTLLPPPSVQEQQSFLQMTGIITTYPLWITITQEYYTSFQKCHWCSFKIPI